MPTLCSSHEIRMSWSTVSKVARSKDKDSRMPESTVDNKSLHTFNRINSVQ